MHASKSFASMLKTTTLLVGAALILTNCQKKEEDPAVGTFSHVYKKTLSTACVACHVPTGAVYADGVTLDFSSQVAAFQTLTTKKVATPSNPSSSCKNTVSIVVAGNATNSYLAGVLFADHNTNHFAGVTSCQPYTAHLTDQNLSAEEKTSILQWIQGGALNN